MQKLKAAVDNVLEKVLWVLMAAMTVNVLWQVFTRFILDDPSSYTEELARYFLIWVGLLGAAYVAGKKMHLAIDYLVGKFNPANRIRIEIFTQALVFVFALIAMFIGGIRLMLLTVYLQQTSAALQLQLGYIYTVVPLSGLLIMFYMVANIAEDIKKLSNPESAGTATAEE